MDPPGIYSVILDGEEIASGGPEMKFGEILHIGNCDCPEGTSLLSVVAVKNPYSMEWALSHENHTLVGKDIFNGTMSGSVEIFEECIPDGCWYLTNTQCDESLGCLIYTDWSYNVTYKGTSQSDSGGCQFCNNIPLGECWSNKILAPTPGPTSNPTLSPQPSMKWTPFPTYPAPTIVQIQDPDEQLPSNAPIAASEQLA